MASTQAIANYSWTISGHYRKCSHSFFCCDAFSGCALWHRDLLFSTEMNRLLATWETGSCQLSRLRIFHNLFFKKNDEAVW